MDQLLSRPEFQSAIIPFVIALLGFAGLRKITPSAWPLALLVAFLVSAGLINGLVFTPLTGTRKAIVLVAAALAVVALLPLLLRRIAWSRSLVTGLCLLGLAWVFAAVVARMEWTAMLLALGGTLALVAALSLSFARVVDSQARLHGAGLGLMLGTGLCATAGASALLGQLALALSAAVGGMLLGWVLLGGAAKSASSANPLSTLPYVMAAALFGLAATIFARMPWYALIPLAAIPLAASLVPLNPRSRFLAAFVFSLPGLVIALATAYWVWQAASASASGY